MAIYRVTAPDGHTYRIEGPENASEADVIRAVQAQYPYAQYSTEELKAAPRAPGTWGDTARAGLASLAGSAGAIASAFGAESAPAKGLRSFAADVQAGMSPARLEEMRRREELIKRGEEQGTGSEIMAGLGAVGEAPVQSVVSGLASSVPAIVAGSAILLAEAPLAIAGAVALMTKLAVGALQGAGETKGNIFDTVTQKLMEEKGLSRAEAEAQAIKAQEYIGQNAPGIMGGAAAGMLDAVTGVESILGKTAKAKQATRPLTQPGVLRTAGKAGLEEAVPEAIQAGVGKVAENVALQNAGFDTSTFSGVAGAAARDALMGALTGSAVSPLQLAQLRKEYEADKQRRLNEEQEKLDVEIRKEQEALRQQQEAKAAEERAKEEEMLSQPPVPVPSPVNVHPVRNPYGNIAKEDLQAEGIDPYLSQHIDEYRKSAGLPPVQNYSIEDIADSMPGVNPVEEQAQIDAILNARTGYQGERLTAQDVMDQAAAKQVDKDEALGDFLVRTTGQRDLRSMSQPQLYAAFKAIQGLPEGASLETGTNAVRFTDKQYNAAIKGLDKIVSEEPILVGDALKNIKLSTGLTEDAYAQSVLEEAVRRGDVDRRGDKITAPTTAESLPEGYSIQEGEFERGERPEGFQIQMGEEVLPEVYDSEESANTRAEEVRKVQGQMVRDINNQITQRQNDLEKAQENLTRMQAAGQQGTLSYDKANARLVRLQRSTNDAVTRLNEQLARLDPEANPVSVVTPKARKVKGRGFTLFKDNKAVKFFKSRQEAEDAILGGMEEKDLQELTKAKGRRTLAPKAQKEIERRAQPEPKVEAKPEPKPEFEPTLRALLDRFGLKNVALNIEKDMKADGEYAKSVIKVALDSANPVRTLRHESIHALKELGFFKPNQWKALENMAKRQWINTYLKRRNINGEPLEAGQQSRYDAYMNVYKGDQDAIIEEAIADAFGDFDQTRAPIGMVRAILRNLKLFFEALRNALTGAGFQTYEDVFGKVERGELRATEQPTEGEVKQSYRATPEDVKEAEKYYAENGIMPYLSEGQLDIPVQVETKFSLKMVSKYDKYDDQFGLPLNKNGTVTLYYHTTRERAQEAVANKKITNDTGKNRVYLTNESAGWKTLEEKGALPQDTDGTVIMVNVDPKLLNLLEEYNDGRKDFFIPTKEGAAFIRKMQMFSIVKDRKEAISKNVTLNDIGDGITTGLSEYLALNPKERKDRLKQAKDVLREEHNVANLLGENGKLEKTRVGDYGLTYEGKSINSRGLGLASAQKINEKLSTCPNSAICEDLCLGETSGNNLMYGGAAGESYSGNIARSAFKAGPRMSQYLKTEALVLHPQEFAISLHEQIRAFVRKCEKEGYQPAIRLNVTSDFAPKVFEAVIKANPDVMFYDYTKLGSDPIAPNHHLTYSSTGVSQIVDGKKIVNRHSNWAAMRKRLDNGQNVAMAFTTKEVMPSYIFDEETGTTYQVWDGDNYDARFLDPKSEDGMGMIVGLTNKAATLKESNAAQETDGFFVYYDPKVDGDTVTIRNQNKLAGKIPIKAEPTKKLSLRDTPQFKNWFGDSKIVNEDGTPKVMYHGTSQDITSFKPKQANAIFVTEDPEFAASFADMSGDYMVRDLANQLDEDPKTKRDLLIPLIDKAIAERELGTAGNSKGLIKKTREDHIKHFLEQPLLKSINSAGIGDNLRVELSKRLPSARNIMPLYVKAENPFDYENPKHVDALHKELEKIVGEEFNFRKERLSRGDWSAIENETSQEVIKSLGFDSFYVEEGGRKNLGVYNPEQLKSATGNVGTFDKYNPDIRYSLRKAPDWVPQKIWDLHEKSLRADDEATGRVPLRPNAQGNTPSPGSLKRNQVMTFRRLSQAVDEYVGNDFQKANDLMVRMNEESNRRADEEPTKKLSLRDNTDPAIRDAVDRITTAREEKGFIQRMMDAISPESVSSFRAKALNRYDRLADYDKELLRQMGGAKLMADSSAEAAALMSDLGAGLTASALGVHDRAGGIPVYKNGVTTVTNLNNTVKGPIAIFAPLAKYGDPYVYQLYQFYAATKRGKRLLKDGRESLITQADINVAQQLLKQYPEFDQIQKEWVKFNNGLVQFLVDTGVLSKNKADEFTRYSDYVPFYRQFEGERTIGPNLFASISGVKGPKKLKGSEAPLADFLETVVRNTQSSIQMGIKNVAAQRAAEVAVKIGEAERLNYVSSDPTVFTVLENGKLAYYQSNDHLLINAIKSLNLPDLPFIGLLAGPANVLRNLVTKDPGFMLANMVRDSMSAYVTSGANMKPVLSTVGNFGKAIAGTSPEYQKLLNAGLIGGYEFSQNIEQSGRTMEEALRIKAGIKKGKDYFTGVWQALEKGTTASDAATRMEVYKNTLAETGNEAEALFRAMEVMNFNRKGSSAVIRILTAAIPFMNARMQGLDVLYRAGIRPTIKRLKGESVTEQEKQTQRTFFVRGMTMFALSCMYWALTHDDDEYKKQEQETRDNYWLVPSMGVKIPIPFEVGILFKVIPERIMGLAFGDDTGKDFAESMERQLRSTLTFTMIPQVALPIYEVKTNHSFFTGRDIIPQGLKDVAPQYQVGPGTSLFAQWLGQQAGLSPIEIDHLYKGYTGTMGMYAVDILDMIMDLNGDSPKVSKRVDQLPIIKRFALDPEARGTVTAYYDLKNSVDEVTRTVNLLERTGQYEDMGKYMQDNMQMLAVKDYIQDLEKQMKELREMRTLIRSSQMTGDQKRDAITDITKMENQLTSNIQSLKKLVAK